MIWRFRRWFFSTLWRCPCGCNCDFCRRGRHRGRTWGWTVPNWKLSAKRARILAQATWDLNQEEEGSIYFCLLSEEVPYFTEGEETSNVAV